MDRETFINLENQLIQDASRETLYTTIISEYCLEKGKRPEDVAKFLTIIRIHPAFFSCFDIALRYFERKFEVFKLQLVKEGIVNNLYVY